MKKRNQGFTLMELGIVLIIIALIIAMVSTVGPQLIENGRGKELLKQITDIRMSVQQFVERYKLLPGDIPAKDEDFSMPVSAACKSGDGNGLVNKNEPPCVTEHLFLARLIPSPLLPNQNGTVQIISNKDAQDIYTATVGVAPVRTLSPQARNIVLIRDVLCGLALTVDQGLDDGSLTTGNSVVSMSGACTGSERIWLAVALQ